MSNNQLFSTAISDIFAHHNKTIQGFAGKASTKRKHGSRKELELALSMLLVELAGSDQNFDAREYNVISNGLRRIFGTTKDEVAALINQATLNLAHLRGTGRFATLLKENMTLEERQVVMEVIEEVIAADGVEDGFETYLRHKFSDLLGVPSKKLQ